MKSANSMSRLSCIFALAFAFLGAINFAADAEPKPLFTILYTAESHAALLPCDCPLQPLGGVARRATLIKRFRERGPVLLLDGGGWAAGGIYDEDSDGDTERDKLRTKLTCDAMRLMKYDVMAMGLTESNLLKTPGDAPAPVPVKGSAKNFDAIEIAKERLQIYAWSEPGVKQFGKPAETIPKIWGWSRSQPLSIHICRCGEDESITLPKATGANLVLVAGRKKSQRISWLVEGASLVNFDYQSRNLIVVEVFKARPASGQRFEFRTHLEPLGKDVPDDPSIAQLLAPHLEALKKKGRKRIEIEYWMMPDCPGCKDVRPQLQQLAKDLGDRANIVPHWVVTQRGTELASLHGEEELVESRVQALIGKYYPEKIWDWLAWRAEHREAWQTGAAALDMLPARIEGALNAKEADALLRADIELSARRHVDATPSLVIGNRLFEGQINRLHLLGSLCGQLEAPKPESCKDAPACFSDVQCRERGYVVKCVDKDTPKARCEKQGPAVKVPATILVDRDALETNLDKIVEALIGDLPGIDYTLVDIATPEGKELAERAGVTRIPAYLLDPIAKTESDYTLSVGRYAREISIRDAHGADVKMLALREDNFGIGANRLFARPRLKGRADLFVSRFSKYGQEALETALDCAASREAAGLTLIVHDILKLKPAEEGAKPQLAAEEGLPEVEEAARAMAVRMLAPEKLNAYWIERGKNRGSSYWDVPLKKVGIDPDKIRAMAEQPAPEILRRLYDEAPLFKSLETVGRIVLLAENCELISVKSPDDLRQILARIASRK